MHNSVSPSVGFAHGIVYFAISRWIAASASAATAMRKVMGFVCRTNDRQCLQSRDKAHKSDRMIRLTIRLGFSPLEQDGQRFGSPVFVPRVDVVHDHGGFFEWTVCTGNSGFAFVLLIEDRESPNGLLELCRSVLRAASTNDYEGRRQ